jgi:hypothetical protein
MTPDRDIERILDQWIGDGPTLASDRVIDVVVDRIERQGQRPGWRPRSWREAPMSTYVKPLAAIAAVIVIALSGYVLLGGPAGQVGTGGPTPRPTPTASPTPPPTPTPSFDVQGQCGFPLSTCRGSLSAGTYASRAFQPVLTYSVPSGWFNKFDAPRGYGLLPRTAENMNSLNAGGYGITSLEVQRDLMVARADCVEAPEPGVGRTARAMVEALHARPGLVTTRPDPISIGGRSGFMIDITMAPDWKTPCPFSEGEPTVPLVLDGEAEPGTGLHWTVGPVDDDSFTRFIILDVPGGGTVLISPSGPPAFVVEATPIIATFKFAP